MIKDDEKDLIAFTKLWDESIVSNDSGRIGNFMSDDWVIIGSDGISTKASFLEWISTGILTHNRMDADEMKVTIHGNTGIVVSRGTSAGTYSGDNFSLYEWSTSVFIKNDGKWLCVLTMLTPAKENM